MNRIAMTVAAALLGLSALAGSAAAQQALRLPIRDGGPPGALSATLYRPPGVTGPAAAVAIFHGCGGVGVNLTRMAQRLAGQGLAALVVDSFGARGVRDACTRNWPSLAQARDRTRDVDSAVAWLSAQPFVAADRVAVMGYSYGGGVVLMATLAGSSGAGARAVIAVYPDCALPLEAGSDLMVRQPVLLAMAELDDWTPVAQCQAMLRRVTQGGERVEGRIYPGAHHSFDAVGRPVTYLAAAGNRSKPNNCCGAHYGHHAPAFSQFTGDVDTFVARHLGPR